MNSSINKKKGYTVYTRQHIYFLLTLYVYCQIGPFQATKSERAKVKVKVRLNLHGIVSIESATVSNSDIYCPFSLQTFRALFNSSMIVLLINFLNSF